MNSRRLLTALCLLLATSTIASLTQAASPGEQCNDLFMSIDMYTAEITTQMSRTLIRGQNFNPRLGLSRYQRLAAKDPVFAQLFPEREVTRIFATEEMPFFERRLEDLINELTVATHELNGQPSAYLAQILRHDLVNIVPKSQIEQRISLFLEGKTPIERILGDNTFRETQVLFHGGHPFKPTPESLLGQYLAETKASTVERTFNVVVSKPPPAGQGYGDGGMYAQGETAQGERRLVVAVDAKSFEIWKKYFYREDMLSVFAHAQVLQNGKIASYSANYGDGFRAMSKDSVLPGLILKTTEAQRAEFYMNVVVNRGGRGGWDQQAMVPWKIENYCSIAGGYETCTHWIGNMPIGDKRVDSYSFPGAMDRYAQNQTPPGVDEASKKNPRYADLKIHNGATDARLNKLFQAPGYEQLSSVIGQEETNVRGEWANPGWLITSLIGPTSTDYVPFVFVFADDATAPIDPKFVPHYETPL